jgi:hypothetical protein
VSENDGVRNAQPRKRLLDQLGLGVGRPIVRSLTVIREDLSARRCKLFPMLLEAGKYREISLIQ